MLFGRGTAAHGGMEPFIHLGRGRHFAFMVILIVRPTVAGVSEWRPTYQTAVTTLMSVLMLEEFFSRKLLATVNAGTSGGARDCNKHCQENREEVHRSSRHRKVKATTQTDDRRA